MLGMGAQQVGSIRRQDENSHQRCRVFATTNWQHIPRCGRVLEKEISPKAKGKDFVAAKYDGSHPVGQSTTRPSMLA